MLQLKNINKEYKTGDLVQRALDDVSLGFRDNEFVAILGPSGSGKTTLLNIIGGLDRYDSGDLIINGISTKKYKDRDWDSYRNHTIGFVFQSYNLIPHQNILSNVELALTISGISKRERRKRARNALESVGLGEQCHKKPNQLSGGQMQRVAIARALVNNPDILLADEPTGALDSDTSVQVMELLKEVARDRLVIMVTHNPELANDYATRIVKLKDGHITDDSMPVMDESSVKEEYKNLGTSSMKLTTSLALSFNNLKSKMGRTILTAFAGSIGIIGIALILSLSQGTQTYIDDTEKSTLSQYPLTIQGTSVDTSSIMTMMMSLGENDDSDDTPTEVTTKPIISDMITSMTNDADKNDMKSIKKWLDSNPDDIKSYTTDIQYVYNSTLNIYKSDTSNGVIQVNPSDVLSKLGINTSGSSQQAMMSSTSISGGSSYDTWVQMMDNEEVVKKQFNVLSGKIPTTDDEVAIVVNSNGEISDYTLYALGVKDKDELEEMLQQAMEGKEVTKSKASKYSFEDLEKLEFTAVPSCDLYEKNGELWEDKTEDEEFMKTAVANGIKVKVVGVLQATSDSMYSSPWGFIVYNKGLKNLLIDRCNGSQIAKDQEENPDVDIFTGIPFDLDENMTMEDITNYISMLPADQQSTMSAYLAQMKMSGQSEEQIIETFKSQMQKNSGTTTYDNNLDSIGVADYDEPDSINIYPTDFEAKDKIDEIITDHNNDMADANKEDEQIHYTDMVGMMMDSITRIINAITYILIAFVAVSLVVSSIMIGIITYISVLERTKEIGILRAIGASKKNISQVFNAETFIIGLFAGGIGIGVSELLIIPANLIIHKITDNADISAILPIKAAIILIILSVILTLIGGIIPSRKAAKKDPVLALRSE